MNLVVKLFLALATVALCSNLFAQAEPEKSASPALPGVNKPGKPPTNAVPPPPTSPAAAKSGSTASAPVDRNPKPLTMENMDPSVKPQDDFFLYTNGSWIKRTEIPGEFSRWGSVNELIDKNNSALREIAEKAGTATADATNAREI